MHGGPCRSRRFQAFSRLGLARWEHWNLHGFCYSRITVLTYYLIRHDRSCIFSLQSWGPKWRVEQGFDFVENMLCTTHALTLDFSYNFIFIPVMYMMWNHGSGSLSPETREYKGDMYSTYLVQLLRGRKPRDSWGDENLRKVSPVITVAFISFARFLASCIFLCLNG